MSQDTYLFENQVILETRITKRVAAQSSDASLDEFETDRTDEFFECVSVAELLVFF